MTTQDSPDVTPAWAAASAKPSLATRISYYIENYWLSIFNTAWGVFVILPWVAPVLMWLNLTTAGRVIYFVYNFFCHQLPERSWFLFGPQFSYSQPELAAAWGRPLEVIGNELIRRQFIGTELIGWKVAWSDRMVGMYTSIFLFGLLYALFRRYGWRFPALPIWGFFLCVVPLGLDGTAHLINDVLGLTYRHYNEWAVVITGGIFPASFYVGDAFGSLNSVLRVVSGLIFGYGMVGFLWPLMDMEFSRHQDEVFEHVR